MKFLSNISGFILMTGLLQTCFGDETTGENSSVTTPSPVVIEQELVDAEKEFSDAKKMFNPWYTGPLLAPSATLISPGSYNIQPYLFVNWNYGKYQQSGKMERTPMFFQLYPQNIFQFGITDWMEGLITLKAQYNKESHRSYADFADLPVGLGFQLLAEGPYKPAILLSLQEVFPTGNYQKLNPTKNGIDATGAGAYTTNIYLNFSKCIWWWWLAHPMNFRLSLEYSIPSHVSVKGFNAYGGGYDTAGKVHPGQTFSADFGYEFSFTQNWALALDIVYNYTFKTRFYGYPGRVSSDPQAALASVGGPYNDQLSLAPAIEYNWNENLGVIVGTWFTVWGRNSTAFASGVFSVTYTF
jgi:hypothetical protein